MSLLRMISSSGQTTTSYSSRTIGSILSRFLGTQIEEDDFSDEIETEAFVESYHSKDDYSEEPRMPHPVTLKKAASARKEIMQKYYRSLFTNDNGGLQQVSTSNIDTAASRLERNNRRLTKPNLNVPVGNEFITLAQ